MKRLLPQGNDDHPIFELPIENELLRLKLRAEFGAECMVVNSDIPDLVVNEFLRSVYDFEMKFRQPSPSVRIYDKIHQPYFRKAELLDDAQITLELKRLLRCMQQFNLQLDIIGEYHDRTIYRFLTEEFFYTQMEDVDMPGFIHHFCYEDFHPNHELDIRLRVVEFLSQWFSKQVNEYSWQLYEAFQVPGQGEYPKAKVLEKVEQVFSSYVKFLNCEYLVTRIEFAWDRSGEKGQGTMNGKVRYDAQIENGETIHIEGPYEFHLINKDGWWCINYFVFPGFEW